MTGKVRPTVDVGRGVALNAWRPPGRSNAAFLQPDQRGTRPRVLAVPVQLANDLDPPDLIVDTSISLSAKTRLRVCGVRRRPPASHGGRPARRPGSRPTRVGASPRLARAAHRSRTDRPALTSRYCPVHVDLTVSGAPVPERPDRPALHGLRRRRRASLHSACHARATGSGLRRAVLAASTTAMGSSGGEGTAVAVQGGSHGTGSTARHRHDSTER